MGAALPSSLRAAWPPAERRLEESAEQDLLMAAGAALMPMVGAPPGSGAARAGPAVEAA